MLNYRPVQQALGVSALMVALMLPCHVGAAEKVSVSLLESGLDKPWSIAELPNGDLLITEKPGRLLRRTTEGLLSPIKGVPEVYFAAQGGLFEVLLHPDFVNNRWLYMTYAGGDEDANRTTVIRARLGEDRLDNIETLLEVDRDKEGAYHFGGKLAFLRDGSLLVTVGEGYDYLQEAQALDSELGKVLRINADGSLPADNPFPDHAPRVYSYGHRNPQGLLRVKGTDTVWLIEHGPMGGDELNLLQPGINYGWPAITYGLDYSGEIISPYTEAEGMEQPVEYWVPSIAPSGLARVEGPLFPEWTGDLLTGALKDRKLYRLDLEEGKVVGQSEPFPEIVGRVRDIRIAGDGSVLVITDEGELYRIGQQTYH
ncbi:soluble aldose sugar dehydrogenase YliI [Luminiphilus syltensis NOR5-1B]|uniref:Soluble aldose sugar dehydrogenase YliI n=1 Tax=Luminiphilus syltensis NOR5-1B TaxID=565045 RepID=B8KTN3_9GAMM|nr:PQQ-dependent sugar dehydrogenase [Luminiphilus syltensis]EED34549.1 soluble aldose sugar dehydrogenase YliI [Luminiphilus syltensis NOR5-1B]